MSSRSLRACGGQASIELVGLLPLLVAVGLGVAQMLASGAAEEAAGGAAQAGAVALLQDRDPRGAARTALPAWSQDRARITLTGRKVRVRVRPRGPIASLTRAMTVEAVADAGPDWIVSHHAAPRR